MKASSPKIQRRHISGVFLLNKPLGISSNAALQKVRWLFRAQKAGHTGALDPLASGLLPICLGEATKFSHFLLDSTKRYQTTIQLGHSTTTGDVEGEVLLEAAVPALTEENILTVLAQQDRGGQGAAPRGGPATPGAPTPGGLVLGDQHGQVRPVTWRGGRGLTQRRVRRLHLVDHADPGERRGSHPLTQSRGTRRPGREHPLGPGEVPGDRGGNDTWGRCDSRSGNGRSRLTRPATKPPSTLR